MCCAFKNYREMFSMISFFTISNSCWWTKGATSNVWCRSVKRKPVPPSGLWIFPVYSVVEQDKENFTQLWLDTPAYQLEVCLPWDLHSYHLLLKYWQYPVPVLLFSQASAFAQHARLTWRGRRQHFISLLFPHDRPHIGSTQFFVTILFYSLA